LKVIKKAWYPKFGQKLHTLQLRILLKGLNMLKKDGLMVYSTCSMNPIEDEAVRDFVRRVLINDK